MKLQPKRWVKGQSLIESDTEPIPITITQGYSRDNRPDLKQFILNLIVTGDGIGLWTKSRKN